MEKKTFDEEEYLNRCKCKPGWVKDKDDAMKYAAHLAHRLYQSKEREQAYYNALHAVNSTLAEEADRKAEMACSVLDKVFWSDKNPSNFTDWTPTKTLGELYPEYLQK